MTGSRTLLAAATLFACTLAEPRALAKPPEVRECLSAHESAVTLRRTGKLREARKRLVTCAADSCPADVRKECGERLADLDASVPTIVLDAAELPAASVRVSADGEVVAERLDGLAIPIDPGAHVLRIECGGGRTYEERIFVAEGDKRRRVIVACRAPDAARETSPAVTPAVEPRAGVRRRDGLPLATVVLGGVAIAGAAVFTTFAIMGRSKESELASQCRPRCTDDQVAPARTQYLVADVALGVGIVAAVSAVVVALWPRSATAIEGRF